MATKISSQYSEEYETNRPLLAQLFLRSIPNYQITLLISAFLLGASFSLILLFKYILSPPPILYNVFSEDVLSWTIVVGVMLGILGFFGYVADKLGVIESPASRVAAMETRIEREVILLRDQIEKITQDSKEPIAERQLTPDLERIANEFFQKTTFQQIEKEIENRYGSTVNIAVKVRSIREGFSGSINSLSEQLAKQRNNANINLLLGLIFSSSGILVMGYFIYLYLKNEGVASHNLTDFVVYSFMPKFTFVILVETVAFFFLNLYREDRNMIRYFRNEMTNLESKYLALETSARFEDKQSLSKVLLILANTERNFTMKKNEKLIFQALREEDSRLFDKTVEKILGVVEGVTKRSDLRTAGAGKKAD